MEMSKNTSKREELTFATVIEGDEPSPVKMVRVLKDGGTEEEIVRFVEEWCNRYGIKPCADEKVDIVYTLKHGEPYWWDEKYCLQVCKGD